MSGHHEPETLYAQLVSKAVLNPDETELYELTQLAGVTVDPEIFKILLDLLKLNVPPLAIVQSLRSMCSSHPRYNPNEENQPPHHGTSHSEEAYTGSVQMRTKRTGSGLGGDRPKSESYRGRSTSSERDRRAQAAENQRSSYTHSSSSAKSAVGSSKSSSYATDSVASTGYRSSAYDKRGTAQSRGESYSSRNTSQLSSAYRDPNKKRSSFK